MRKSIKFFMCMLVACMIGAIGASVTFAENTDIVKSFGWSHRGGLSLNWSNAGDSITYGYIAVYDNAGTLVQIAHNSGSEARTALIPYIDGGNYTMKSFLWNSDMQPEAETEQINIISVPCETITDWTMNNDVLSDIQAKTENGTQKYRISDSVSELHINGVPMPLHEELWNKYVINNTVGNLMLQDTDSDGLYDDLCVTYYVSGVVKSIRSSFNDTISIVFDNCENIYERFLISADASIPLDGKTVNITDLQKGDVISVAYDVSNSSVALSKFHDVIACLSETIGVVEALDGEKGYLADGQYYKPMVFDGGDDKALEIDKSYRLWTDVFGRLVYYEENPNAINIGILDCIYTNTDMEIAVSIMDKLGQMHTYALKDEADAENISKILGGHWIENGFQGDKAEICDRVVEYDIDEEQRISILHPIEGDSFEDIFNKTSGVIDYVNINSEAHIFDASGVGSSQSPGNANPIQLSDLTDGTAYSGCAYIYSYIDNEYYFIIITGCVNDYYVDGTQFTVFNKELVTTDWDGNAVKAVELYIDGDLYTYEIDPDVCPPDQSLSQALGKDVTLGDLFLIKIDNFRLSEIDVLYDNNLNEGYAAFKQEAFRQLTSEKTEDIFNIPQEWQPHNENSGAEIAFGPIVDRAARRISLAALNSEGVSHGRDNVDYELNSNTKVYVFDYSKSGRGRLYPGSIGDIMRSIGFRVSDETIDWTSPEIYTNFAIVKSVDGIAEQVFVILSDE